MVKDLHCHAIVTEVNTTTKPIQIQSFVRSTKHTHIDNAHNKYIVKVKSTIAKPFRFKVCFRRRYSAFFLSFSVNVEESSLVCFYEY